MADIGDLLPSRPASCIQLLTDTQLLCKKNIVVRIIATVVSFNVDVDVSLIYKKVSISAKMTLVRLFSFLYFLDG